MFGLKRVLSILRSLWRLLFRRNRLDQELDDEVRSHLALMTDEKIAEGMNPEQARRAARIEVGGVEQVKERVREARAAAWFDTLLQDVRFGLRMLRKNPGFTTVAVLTLALGIGANTAIFSMLNAVLLRSLPYGHPERLVNIWIPNRDLPQIPIEVFGPSNADFFDIQRRSDCFSSLTLFDPSAFNLETAGAAERVGGTFILPSFFSTLGVSPEIGRGIETEDVQPGHGHVAVISNSLWQSAFGGTPEALGKLLILDGQTYQIVGVMPPTFTFDDSPYESQATRTDVWLPMVLTDQQKADRDDGVSDAIGRLRPGVSVQQAQAELNVIMGRLDPLHNSMFPRGWYGVVRPLLDTVVGKVRFLVWLLFGAVSLVLLIACANTANLLLARAATRTHEMGVRAALGARRGRLVRQVLTEAVLLATCGGATGILVAHFGIRALLLLNPGDIPRLAETVLDARVLLFTTVVSLGTGILFGVLPALGVSRTNVTEFLRAGGGRVVVGTSRALRHTLIVAEVTFAVILLAGSGLLIRSYINVENVATGFSDSTVTMHLSLDARYNTPEGRKAFFYRLLDKIDALPSVRLVGAIDDLPLTNSETVSEFMVEGYRNKRNQLVHSRWVTEQYFQAMRTPLIAGRFFTDEDATGSAHSIIINLAFAKAYFPGESALGKHVCMCFSDNNDVAWSTVVGVVSDVRHANLEDAPPPQVYQPFWQGNLSSAYLAIRAAEPPVHLIPEIRQAVSRVDPTLAVADIRTMGQLVLKASARRRFETFLLAALAALAFFLAAIGIYGVIAFSVRQRTREIGVRVALGAQRRDILHLVLRQGMVLAVIGTSLGIAGAVALTRFLGSLLYQVHPFDALTFAVTAALLLIIAFFACYVPARKAMRVDPMATLRHE